MFQYNVYSKLILYQRMIIDSFNKAQASYLNTKGEYKYGGNKRKSFGNGSLFSLFSMNIQ